MSHSTLSNSSLTSKEDRFLRAWNNLKRKLGRPPKTRRVMRELGYKSPRSISQFKSQLLDKGINLYA